MCCGKCFRFLINYIIPYSILCIFLFQIYAQYSTLVTLRNKNNSQKDGRNTLSNYKLMKNKEYDFNMNKVQESFEDNALMKINIFKNTFLGFLDKKSENFDIRVYMFFYLICYDLICLIIVYFFIYGSIKAGFLKIIFQIIRFYFNSKRMQKFNTSMNLFAIIKAKLENMYLYRGWSIFNPEGFLIIELLCNFGIILDIILLIFFIYRKNKYRRIKSLNIIKDDGEVSIEEEKEEDNKSEDKNDKNSEDNEKESNGESKSNENNEISKKKGEGKLDSFFENENEDNEVSEEESGDNTINNGETKSNN